MSTNQKRSVTRGQLDVRHASAVEVELSAYSAGTPLTLKLKVHGTSKLKGSSIRKIDRLWKTFSEEVLALN